MSESDNSEDFNDKSVDSIDNNNNKVNNNINNQEKAKNNDDDDFKIESNEVINEEPKKAECDSSEEIKNNNKIKEKMLTKNYEKKLEDLKKQCCKELKILNEKIEKSQKNKKGYYELFIIENDLNFEFELMERNIKNDEERALWEIKKNEFDELRRELAEIRGEVLD